MTATDPADGRRFPLTVDGTVLGWERVRVPAGEFDALKIERVVFLRILGIRRPRPERNRETEWYAPAVKQAVRREASAEYLSYFGGATSIPGSCGSRQGRRRRRAAIVRDDWLIYELESYSVR